MVLLVFRPKSMARQTDGWLTSRACHGRAVYSRH